MPTYEVDLHLDISHSSVKIYIILISFKLVRSIYYEVWQVWAVLGISGIGVERVCSIKAQVFNNS
jgi:hypothetical protein